jgi:hypothetical protein
MHPIYAGAAEHHLNDGSKRRFTPRGPMYIVPGRDSGRGRGRSAGEDVQDYAVGLSARLFVGLNVGQTPTYTIEQVVSATRSWRERNRSPVDSSFIAQKGLYTPDEGDIVEENSVQIIIIDLQGLSVADFTSAIVGLAAYLRTKFDQKSVIVEIQKAGIIQRVLNVTAETTKA